jgi:hypothetical protein
MRLRADEEKARAVKEVLLDGKPVPMVYEFDTDEAWVKSYVVMLPDELPANGEELVEDDDSKRAGFQLIKRSGKVEVTFNDPSKLDD